MTSKLKKSAGMAAGLVAAAALAVPLAGCGGPAADQQAGAGSGPVRIGSALDLTAYLAGFDRRLQQGIRQAEAQINGAGGLIDGRKLEVSFEDMKADPQQAVRSVQKLADQRKVVAFLNGASSAGTAAVTPIAASRKLPMVVSSVIPDNAEWQFSTLPAPPFETGVRTGYLAEKGVKRIAVLRDATPYNEAQFKAIQEQAKQYGMKIVGTAEHESDAVDLRPQVTRLLNRNPQAILKLSAGPTHIVAAKAMASSQAKIPLLLSIEQVGIVRDASKAYPDTFFAASPPQVYSALRPDQRSKALTTLVENAKGGEDLTFVGRGYDSTLLLADAIKRAKSTDGDAVRKALEDAGPFEGSSGTYDFSATAHYGLTRNPLFLAQIRGDADPAIVFTPKS